MVAAWRVAIRRGFLTNFTLLRPSSRRLTPPTCSRVKNNTLPVQLAGDSDICRLARHGWREGRLIGIEVFAGVAPLGSALDKKLKNKGSNTRELGAELGRWEGSG